MIHIRSKREIELIRNSCQIVVEAFRFAEQLIKPGVQTSTIDKEVGKFIQAKGARPAFKGYRGFPANICISVEEEVVHGIPGSRVLQEGEIVSVDIGVECEGFFGDGAKTYAVGEISPEKKKLMRFTLQALNEGVKEARAGARLSNISNRVQTVVESAKYSVVRDLVGHGVGRKLHEDPQIPNYGLPNSGPRLRPGMVLAIEPMVNLGNFEVVTADDNWTVLTEDGLPSAHFEHTVVVTEGDPDILTIGL
ncbi:MAG TPA: type I methionyl aminopeptidase [bacterium]